MASMDDLVTEIRGRLGDPSEAELPDTQINLSIEGAVREFSRFHPSLSEVTIDLVAGEAEYALPEGVTGVSESSVMNTYFSGFSFELQRPKPQDDLDAWRKRAPSVEVRPIDLQLEVYEGEDGPMLRVFPEPRLSGKLALVVEKVREVTAISRKDIEGVVQWAIGDCLEYRGRKRSKSVSKIPTATGTLTLDDGKDLRIEGEEVKCRQETKWGRGASVMEVG